MKPSGCLHVGAVVLAAGAATRMGQLKQLLPYNGRTLVQHAVGEAIKAGFGPIVVVVGAEADRVRAAVAAQPVDIAQNGHWSLGMGSSISAGIRQLLLSGVNSAAVAILLADQPLVTAAHLRAMRIALYTGAPPIVAAQYNGTLGVPALFRRELFGTLEALKAETGARQLLRDSKWAVTAFPLQEAATDVDTPQDFEELRAKS